MVYYKSNNINILQSIFERYANISGEQINPNKSTIYTGSISIWRQDILATLLEFSIGFLPFTYLGIPIFKERPKVA